MNIIVNRKPVAQLAPGVFKYLAKGKPADLLTGRVLTGEEASETFLRSTRIMMTVIAVFMVALIVGGQILTMGSHSQAEQTILLIGGIFALIVAGIALRWIYMRRLRLWQEELPARLAAVPPPGTPVRLDTVGVTAGTRSFDWSQLRIGEIELRAQSDGEQSTLTVERVVLAGPDNTIGLDVALIENGKAMVETACRRLLPAAT